MGGVVAGLSLIVPELWPAAFVALVPLLLAIDAHGTRRSAWMLGLIWGAGLMSTTLSFVFAMLPLDWLGVTDAAVGAGAAVLVWGAVSALLALPAGIFGLVFLYARAWPAPLMAATVPAAWVALELARAALHSVVALGPGTAVGPFFTFGFLGYALAGARGLLLLAPIGGPLFLSGCIVLMNITIFLALRRLPLEAKATKAVVCLAFLITIVAVDALLPARVRVEVGASAAQVGGIDVVLIHTDEDARFAAASIEQDDSRARLAAQVTRSLTGGEADVVVLPEDSRFAKSIVTPTSPAEEEAIALLESRGALLIGSSRSGDTVARGVLYAYDFGAKALVQVSAKSYLVPLGEYVPHTVVLLSRLFGVHQSVQRLGEVRASYRPAPWRPDDRIVRWRGVSLGVLSCSELLNPYFVKDLASAGADAIVVLSSQSWIRGDSRVLFNQLLGMAVVNAAWTGKPWLQATNGAPNVLVEVASVPAVHSTPIAER